MCKLSITNVWFPRHAQSQKEESLVNTASPKHRRRQEEQKYEDLTLGRTSNE